MLPSRHARAERRDPRAGRAGGGFPDEDVLDSGESIAAWYRRERLVALGLAAVDSMVIDGPEEIDENDPRLVAVREHLRDSLRELLNWARQTGRL